MRGLLLKDYYIIKSSTFSLLITFVVIGFGISFVSSPHVLIVLATTVLGMSVVTIINIDKKCGWMKTSVTFPIQRKSIISSKYIMYLLLCLLGALLGTIISITVSFLIKDLNFSMLPLLLCLSIVMTFFAGGIMLPCFYLFDEEKSVIGAMVAYPVAALFMVAIGQIMKHTVLAMATSIVISMIVFFISWLILCKNISSKDI